ncbi:AAA+ superfamily predicted ATPase [Sphaerotilus sulfidivorans]|uniref:AAA+ superfamily predicted ATPase n=1 Tax=Sphaerotilus sulfidivorans TaxID=639200 RepID=A0A5C1Q2U1_9BURK|nr:ATP-binding protein [Sphaerotilus sulfidivorans]NZD46155.1 ATP-binding protein [Sphaerotilus sulfidivorans]QEN01887.1 ATP-binding protein [Sphaerotilus sulfidivorans]
MAHPTHKSQEKTTSKSATPSHFDAHQPNLTLDTHVILPKSTRNQIDECLARLKYHRKIYVDWNFRSVDPMGMSAVLNFFGAPGTGKTLTAQALAGTLGMTIISLGIAELESKFMGETAKNIQAAFSAARENGAVLFFDEADTLLGKRLSSVTQGVDNEVNAMRSTMLIELERFDGIVIFATNFARNFDEAFRSRIGYHVRFELPDMETRIKLWDRMMVHEIPLGEDRDFMLQQCAEASAGMSGREIRTGMRLALPKAVIAAQGEDAKLKFEHIASAIADIRLAHREVATSSGHESTTNRDAQTAKNLLGLN